jgi:hypothetical protein
MQARLCAGFFSVFFASPATVFRQGFLADRFQNNLRINPFYNSRCVRKNTFAGGVAAIRFCDWR